MEIITSIHNPKIKNLSKLISSSRHRRESGQFVLEGLRLCADVLNSEYEVSELYFTQELFDRSGDVLNPLSAAAGQSFLISEEVCRRVSDTKSAQGVFCVCRIPHRECGEDRIRHGGKYIALEQLSDPSNTGAVCRTAEALGIDGVIVVGGCDIYSPKVQRAAMGSLLRIPVISAQDICSLAEECRQGGMKVYASTPGDGAQSITQADLSGGVVVIVGNEANGVSQKAAECCDGLVKIPMKGKAESLNAAAAAAVIMWEMMR